MSIDLPNTILKLLQASLFPFHFTSKLVFLSKILAAFPLLVKTIASSVAGAGGTLEAIARKLTKWSPWSARSKSRRASRETLDPLP